MMLMSGIITILNIMIADNIAFLRNTKIELLACLIYCNNFSSACSERIGMFNSIAFAYLDPGA